MLLLLSSGNVVMIRSRSKKTVIPLGIKALVDEHNKNYPCDKIDVNKTQLERIEHKLVYLMSVKRYCYFCKQIKPLADFRGTGRNKYDLGDHCKKCIEIIRRGRALKEFHGNRHKAIEKSNGKCVICGEDFREVHHIDPTACKDRDRLENLVPLCHACHLGAHNGAYSNINDLNQEMILKFRLFHLDTVKDLVQLEDTEEEA